jgi:transposase
MVEDGLVVGIDVAKGWLDVAVLESGESFRVENDAAGWAQLVKRLKGRRVRAVGLEPSGGYERGPKQALRKAGLPVRNVNPHKLRHFARALGRLAKNDRLDAAVIARSSGLPATFSPHAGRRGLVAPARPRRTDGDLSDSASLFPHLLARDGRERSSSLLPACGEKVAAAG